MAAHQAPLSLGFSRQEHWSGLPFPSPMHESESEVTQSCLTLQDPMDCSLPGSSICEIFLARVLEWVAIAFSDYIACCCCCYVASVVSDSVRPHRWQPNRLPRPWDSPRKNTGVGCHFLLQCMKVKSESEVAQSCPILSDPMDCSLPTRLLHPWDFPGKSTGVGCHCPSPQY